MKYLLFTDSDTYLEFKSHLLALTYASKNNIESFILIKTYAHTETVRVFNPYIQSTKCVEYLPDMDSALKYVGSFL